MDIARDDTDVLCTEGLLEFAEFLVGQRRDGRRIKTPREVLQGKGNSLLGHDRLTGRCVRCHKHHVILLQVVDGLLLKVIQFEWVLVSHLGHKL